LSPLDEVEFLQFQINLLEQNEENQEEISKCIQDHMKLLHDYNEIKDIGQIVIGKIAEIKGCTSREIYLEYGLDLND
jgi:hypothetical protein